MSKPSENVNGIDVPMITFGTQTKQHKSVIVLFVFLLLGSVAVTATLVYYYGSCHTTRILSVCNGHYQERVTAELVTAPNNVRVITTPAYSSGEINTDTSTFNTETETTSGTTEIIPKESNTNLRLPRTVTPNSYNISLIPFLEEGNFTFHGNVTILINVLERSDVITLNADDLSVEKVRVYSLGLEGELTVKDVRHEVKKHFLHILLNEEIIEKKQYYINIVYKGVLNDLLTGFYRSSYTEANTTKWIAVTQFQTTDARRAFPCFDEPALKAKFQISIARKENMISLSNMRKIGSSENVPNLPGYVWDYYEQSVPMSTYLLAFIVCDFESISSGSFSVWARKSAIAQSNYSLDIGPKLLKFYENFFGISYPLTKMDLIALPDFVAGAMENWGLITFRESLLLYESGVSGAKDLQKITQVVAHELAHQWFGNLVTPVWWSDLWLNEGFASYAEYLGSNSIEPSWKMLDQFIIGEVQSSMFLDALRSSHQISIEVNNPDEISNIFDRISYSKGASIIWMMENFLTTDVFRRGLTRYLKERMYSNAEQDDLWHTLTLQSHEEGVLDKSVTVKEIMDTWTLQTGFPVISVNRNYNEKTITFSQKRFTLDVNGTDDKTLWWVPLTFIDGKGVFRRIWMQQEKEIVVEDTDFNVNDFLLVNLNFTGYYRVNYDSRNWNLISDQLNKPNGHLVFDPKNRAQIIDDAFNLVSSGDLSYDIALGISTYLTQERELVPWQAVANHLDYIQSMFEKSPHFDKIKNYILRLIKPFYNELGFTEQPDDPLPRIYSRVEIVERACELGLKECVITAVQLFESWRNSNDPDKHNPISPNLREIVYCTSLRIGGQEEWEFVWRRYLLTNVGGEKETLMNALGCSREPWLLARYLEWALTPGGGIRKQDSSRVFVAVGNNPVGQCLVYRFMKENWERIRNYLGPSSLSLMTIVRGSTSFFNSRDEVDDFKMFVNKKGEDLGVALKTAQQVIEQGEADIKWMSKNFQRILLWLRSH